MSRVLSVSMRPSKLDDIIGQDDTVNEITKMFSPGGNVPRFFLITGETGSGKTTLARIIALMLQSKDPFNPTGTIANYDVTEINASDKNGVDDSRALIELVKYLPINSLYKVIIMDEAQQLTSAAQDALLKITEDTPKHVCLIFCTNNDAKLKDTLKRRAYPIKIPLFTDEYVTELVRKAKKVSCIKNSTDELVQALIDCEIRSPGIILQSAEKFFNGASAINSITGSTGSKLNIQKICSTVHKGDWKSSFDLLKTATKDDVVMLRNCILGYLKTILLKSGSLRIAKMIVIISNNVYELPLFLANIRIACDEVKS